MRLIKEDMMLWQRITQFYITTMAKLDSLHIREEIMVDAVESALKSYNTWIVENRIMVRHMSPYKIMAFLGDALYNHPELNDQEKKAVIHSTVSLLGYIHESESLGHCLEPSVLKNIAKKYIDSEDPSKLFRQLEKVIAEQGSVGNADKPRA